MADENVSVLEKEEASAAAAQAPAAPETVPAAPGTGGQPPIKKKKRKKWKTRLKSLLITLVVLGVLAGGGYLVWKLVFAEEEKAATGEPIYDTVSIGSIVSTVRGGGASNAKDSATITLGSDGVVEEVYVTQGQVVMEGDPLYVITSPAAEEALVAAQEGYQRQEEAIAKLQETMAELQKSRNDLTVTAPHAGKLTDVSEVKVGDPLGAGSTIATLVDDTKLKLSLYYSYAYENDIYVGESAMVSVPAIMAEFAGTVEKINKVERITPEGGKFFEVIFTVNNPGTLTADMAATAALTDGAGAPVYPYESGVFQYYQTTTIATKAAGPVERVAELLNYGNVTAGQVLVVQGTQSVDEQIRSQQEQITAAEKALEEAAQKVTEAEKNVQNFSATAPISGTIITLSPQLFPGAEVESGMTAITIADNTVMTVNINVDDRNRQYIDVGMEIMLNDWNGNSYMGIVETVAVQGTNENGVTVFPAVVRVDNSSGTLMGGVWLDYEFTSAQSQDCLVIPIQDVRYYTPANAQEPQAVAFVKGDAQDHPDAVDKTLLPADMQEEIPEECIVVPVEIGLSDDTMVEIISGLSKGDMVYNNTPSEDGSYWN